METAKPYRELWKLTILGRGSQSSKWNLSAARAMQAAAFTSGSSFFSTALASWADHLLTQAVHVVRVGPQGLQVVSQLAPRKEFDVLAEPAGAAVLPLDN